VSHSSAVVESGIGNEDEDFGERARKKGIYVEKEEKTKTFFTGNVIFMSILIILLLISFFVF